MMASGAYNEVVVILESKIALFRTIKTSLSSLITCTKIKGVPQPNNAKKGLV